MAAAEETPTRLDGGPGVVVESQIGYPGAGTDPIPRDGPDGEGWHAGITPEEIAELAELAAAVAAEEVARDAGDLAPPAAELGCGPPPDRGDVPSPEEEVAPEIGPRPNLFDHRPTEIDRSIEYVDQHGTDLRYCYQRKGWYAWDGRRWSFDLGEPEVARRAEKTARQHLAKEAATLDKERIKAAADACTVAKRAAMVTGARHKLMVRVDDLDKNPWLLVTKNATIDLRTGQARANRREDYITRLAPVKYNPSATCPGWLSFLSHVMGGDDEIVSFIQRSIGYTLTGTRSEHCMFVCVGVGRNGKSTFLDTVTYVLGDYAATAAFDTFLTDPKHGGHNKGFALSRLPGVRMVVASEPDAGKSLDETMLKTVTGDRLIEAEEKYKPKFEFEPQLKLWLATNEAPRLSRGGFALEERLRIIPFDVVIPKGERVKNLWQKLAKEAEGILAWAVQGCRDWARLGLMPPARVADATSAYLDDADPIRGWVEAHVAKSPGSKVSMRDVHRSYSVWAEGQHVHTVSSPTLAKMLRARQFQLVKVGGYSYVRNVVVTMPATDAEEAAGEAAAPPGQRDFDEFSGCDGGHDVRYGDRT